MTGEAYGKCFKGMGGFLFKFYHQMSYTCPKVPLQVNFLRWRHFAFPSMSLIFLRLRTLFMHRWPIFPLYKSACTKLASNSTNECITITFWPVLKRTLAFELRTDKSAAWDCSCASHITIYINLPLKELCHEIDMISEGLMVFKIIEQLTVCDCAAKAFCYCPAIISHRPGSQNILKEAQLNPEKDSRIKRARSHVSLEKSS